MLLLNSLLAVGSCVIKRFVLPGALQRNFPPEGSLSHPPNLKRPRMDAVPFTQSFITVSLGGAVVLSGSIFNLITRQELTHHCRLNAGHMSDSVLHQR